MDIETSYRAYKPLLFRIAYRLLGMAQEAEDAVQDVFLALQSAPERGIEHPKAYLIRAVTNHALNRLTSARRKRESYAGPWLPEPLLTENMPAPADSDPEESYMKQQQYGYAWMVMLERLTPPERAVFVLRETLEEDYGEIAGMLGRSEPACRKLYSRAKQKLGDVLPGKTQANSDEGEAFVYAFTEAAQKGNLQPLIRLLTEDTVLVSDGGGKVRAALRPIIGKERVLAFFQGIRSKGSLQGELLPVRVNGQTGLVLLRENKPPFVLCFNPAPEGGINAVYLVSNPDKLRLAEIFLP